MQLPPRYLTKLIFFFVQRNEMDDIVRKCKTLSDCNFRTLSCGPKIDLVAFSYNFLLFYLLYQYIEQVCAWQYCPGTCNRTVFYVLVLMSVILHIIHVLISPSSGHIPGASDKECRGNQHAVCGGWGVDLLQAGLCPQTLQCLRLHSHAGPRCGSFGPQVTGYALQ